MADSSLDHCGCCAGLDAETPARIDNPPGQSAVAYRVGVHASFRESLLARLSSSGLPALAGLTTRDGGDFTIALCDALATTLDVLSFYQERIANENFLRTATERRSILELARLIGYELAPGVAASTFLAFTLQEVPGSPALAAGPVEIPVGARVQSVPGPDEQPQTFETVEPVEARAEWNAIPVQTSVPWRPRFGDRELWLAGVGNGVRAGDVILVVGRERLDDAGSERWDVRLLTAVEEDREKQRTRIAWDEPLGSASPRVEPAGAGATVYVFRQRAALFGHNAPEARMLNTKDTKVGDLLNDAQTDWKNYQILGNRIDLDAEYPKIVPGGWIALVAAAPPPDSVDIGILGPIEFIPVAFAKSAVASPVASALAAISPIPAIATPAALAAGYVELYRAQSVAHLSRRDYGLSGKTTRIVPDTTENLDLFGLRETLVLAQSEPLLVTGTPLGFPLYGDVLALDRLAPGIGPGRPLALSGKRSRVRLRKGRNAVTMTLVEGGSVTVEEGDSLRLVAAPERKSGGTWLVMSPPQFGERLANPGSVELRLRLLDRDGREGVLEVAAAAIEAAPPEPGDEEVSEIVFVGELASSVSQDRDRSYFTLAAPLKHVYDRETVRVNANVARATHGETVNEILGSGDARLANASFGLRQAPLTFVSAATPSGRQSTLALRANDLLWQEVPSLYARGPNERVYELAVDDQARAMVRFGDGIEGARPPSGDHNLRAIYRKGLGLAGNVAAGKLTTLLSRPLGVTGATNPEPAGGGEDPEAEERARVNAPLTVLTLERAVSIRDYRDFARAFAGIAKAHALWLPSGPARGVFLTVAGEEGSAVPANGDTFRNLQTALRRHGDPLLPLTLVSYRDARFRTRLAVKVAAEAEPELVLAGVEARLREAFGFEARGFGQGVSVDEVAAVAQAVTGVEAVHVAELHRSDTPVPKFAPRLFAALPVASLGAAPLAAELLTLDAAPLVLETMS
jgi:hypothetical protein